MVVVVCGDEKVVVRNVRVGAGRQTCRWLTMIAQQRASKLFQARHLRGYHSRNLGRVQTYYAPTGLLLPVRAVWAPHTATHTQ